MNTSMRRGLLLVAALIPLVNGQTCDNYGSPNGSACTCPPGFGGDTCSQPACGGDIFQGSQRSLVAPSFSNNLTAAGCTCETGWAGTGCNVCQSASACQNGYAAAVNSSSSAQSVSGATQTGQNNTLTCNTQPRVWAASEMSCQVVNPTLQALFPLSSTLNILRTLQPSLTPIPNTTAFGSSGFIFAQLFYDGIEQFYCQADTCTQDLSGSAGSAHWSCQNLKCTCRAGTTFCGGGGKTDLTKTIDGLIGTVDISCDAIDNTTNTAKCGFVQDVIKKVFGQSGLSLSGCTFGECVRQSVIDGNGNSTNTSSGNFSGKQLSGGVIAGLAVVGALAFLALILLAFGLVRQRKARRAGFWGEKMERIGGVAVQWDKISYHVPTDHATGAWFGKWKKDSKSGFNDDKVILDHVSGKVQPGQMMGILGPSGAGKTTLVELLAGKNKSGITTGLVTFPSTLDAHATPLRIGFVPQQDVLPPMLTVFEALLFAARLRLPENVPDSEKAARVVSVMDKLGIDSLRNVRIGDSGDGGKRGGRISGGEMRRVSIGLELVARPDVLILDEPTSGLDSVSASKVTKVLHAVAHDPDNPTAVIASIHQPSSKIYQTFDSILLLSHGHSLYSGAGSFSPVEHLSETSRGTIPPYQKGYNVADYLLEVASDPPVGLFRTSEGSLPSGSRNEANSQDDDRNGLVEDRRKVDVEGGSHALGGKRKSKKWTDGLFGTSRPNYAATFLTQLQVLSGREWKILRRDTSLFFAHVAVSAVLGVFCGGLYYHTGLSIAGFQSRVGCLFFLGALIAFSSLSALYNVVEIRPLFLRERSSSYYSPTAWLLSRFVFDVIPLRIIPTIIVSTITYWMAGLAHDATHFFKFLFILVLYTLGMTLFNFLLGALFRNGGIAILLSALSALFQMTFAGFFVHLNSIPPVLRWLQWICPLKYTLEALAVNEVGSGLTIQDTLEGVPVDVSASLIMNLLFGFGANNYYRDVLVLFAFIAGFGLGVIGIVWLKVRERR